MADALDALAPENRRAWGLSRQLFTRFGYDTHAIVLAVDRLTREDTADDFMDLYERLSMIYDECYPTTQPTEE